MSNHLVRILKTPYQIKGVYSLKHHSVVKV